MRKAMDFETVRKIGLTLPDAEEGTSYGAPALLVHGKMFACVPTHRTAEPGSLAVRVSVEDRAELLKDAPEVYYITDHYVGYPAVLVRLAKIDEGMLRDLLGMAYKFVSKSAATRSAPRKPAKRRQRK
jgi:hypothetical protein